MEIRIRECIKSLQAPNLKTTAVTKTMFIAIRRDGYELIDDVSEESERKKKLYR